MNPHAVACGSRSVPPGRVAADTRVRWSGEAHDRLQGGGEEGRHHAVPMVGDGIEGVVKRVLVSPEEGWDGWVMRLFDIDPGGHTPKHAHDWPHVNFVAAGRGELHLDGEDHQLEAGT